MICSRISFENFLVHRSLSLHCRFRIFIIVLCGQSGGWGVWCLECVGRLSLGPMCVSIGGRCPVWLLDDSVSLSQLYCGPTATHFQNFGNRNSCASALLRPASQLASPSIDHQQAAEQVVDLLTWQMRESAELWLILQESCFFYSSGLILRVTKSFMFARSRAGLVFPCDSRIGPPLVHKTFASEVRPSPSLSSKARSHAHAI